MNTVIYKYVLPRKPGKHSVILPQGGQILSVGLQTPDLVCWVLCDPDAPVEPRSLVIGWTGLRLPEMESPRFIGTVSSPSDLVYHLFEEVPEFKAECYATREQHARIETLLRHTTLDRKGRARVIDSMSGVLDCVAADGIIRLLEIYQPKDCEDGPDAPGRE